MNIIKKHDLNEEEYPKNAWEIWVTQNNYDREEKEVWICLKNEGCEVETWINKGKEYVLDYIKKNEIDITAGLVIS
jgi:hypothetical protein